ncbi:MAG TPA: hypothetical protein VJA21_33415 [Verrucomicrobiae bacterium]
MKFYQLAVGAVFKAWGRNYRKIAMSMAEDERGWGTIFMGEGEIVSEGRHRSSWRRLGGYLSAESRVKGAD